MVRTYLPQNSPGNINVNTNYPPQKFDETGAVPEQGQALVQTGTITALVQTGTLSALVQTEVP